jgi:tetratricopeptide (TPR) repeat protein
VTGKVRAPALLLLGIAIATLRPATANAQMETFVQAVRGLAEAAARPEPARSHDRRAAADRMAAALAEWDRNISALEAQAGREMPGAPTQRAYQWHVQLGVTYRARGRLDDALRQFEAAIALEPSASDVQVLRALTLEAAGRPEEAGQAFRTAWTLDARNPVKAYYLAQRGGTGAAAERARARALLTDTYQRLPLNAATPTAAPFVTLGAVPDNLSRTPIVADETMMEAFARLETGQYSAAVAALEGAPHPRLEAAEASPLLHLERGRNAEAQNRIEDARREYQSALGGTLAGRSVLYVAIARLAQVAGDLDGAVDAFTHAVWLNPNDPDIHRELASAYAAQDRGDAAFCELVAALLIDPRDAQAHAAIGQLYLDAGHAAEAVGAFNRALDLVPDRYEIRYALATAHARMGNSTEAARQLEIYDRARRDALARRRRDIANEVDKKGDTGEPDDAERGGKHVPDQGSGR